MNHPATRPDDERDSREPGSRPIGPDERTLGGIPSAEERRAKRESEAPNTDGTGPLTRKPAQEIPAYPEPEAPADRPTKPALTLPEMPSAGRSAFLPDLPPPDHATAIDLARRFLAGSTKQAAVGRDGAEAIARWVVANAFDLQILAFWRSCCEGSGNEALIQEKCLTALGLRLSAPDSAIYEAREWCRTFIANQAGPDRAMAEAGRPARIYTPAGDGSCMICGKTNAAHQLLVTTPHGFNVECPAVAP